MSVDEVGEDDVRTTLRVTPKSSDTRMSDMSDLLHCMPDMRVENVRPIVL